MGWDFATDTSGEVYSAPPNHLAGLGLGIPGEREGRGKGEEEGVQECSNPKFESLSYHQQ